MRNILTTNDCQSYISSKLKIVTFITMPTRMKAFKNDILQDIVVDAYGTNYASRTRIVTITSASTSAPAQPTDWSEQRSVQQARTITSRRHVIIQYKYELDHFLLV